MCGKTRQSLQDTTERLIDSFLQEDLPEEAKARWFMSLAAARIPSRLHHKVAEICFRCLENPAESPIAKRLAKRLLMRLIGGYPRLAGGSSKSIG